ncbi:MAG: DUF488 family protein [Burkholderiales bacterium]
MATIFSVGHGNRSSEALLHVLSEAGIRRVVDVRAVPRSRRHPHFGYGPLGAALQAIGIEYEWRGKPLGGLRRAADDSRHAGLKEPAFRAFAAHMEGAAFRAAASGLAAVAALRPVCMMCAERDPAQCHRALIADWLVANGHHVVHLVEPGESRAHVLHASVRIVEGTLDYANQGPQRSLF